MQLLWYGLVPYEEGLKIQLNFVDKVRDKLLVPGMVIALEHPPVITLGKRASTNNQDLVWSPAEIFKSGISVCTTDRGGQATLHNPGQLVIYPIIDLKAVSFGVRQYVEILEEATARLLNYHFKNQGVIAQRHGSEPGLYIGAAKIAALGVRIDRGITMHGVAINVKNDLSQFAAIKMCGQVCPVTSMSKELPGPQAEALDLPSLAAQWLDVFEVLLSERTSKSVPMHEGLSPELR